MAALNGTIVSCVTAIVGFLDPGNRYKLVATYILSILVCYQSYTLDENSSSIGIDPSPHVVVQSSEQRALNRLTMRTGHSNLINIKLISFVNELIFSI